MGVVLAGAVLGARRGFLSVVLFLALVAIGLPLLSGGRGGFAVFTTPYAGFLWAFPFAALVVGWLTERRGAPYEVRWGIPFNLVGSLVLCALVGPLAWAAAGWIDARRRGRRDARPGGPVPVSSGGPDRP